MNNKEMDNDDESKDYIPEPESHDGGTFAVGNTIPTSPFVMNRAYAQYNPSKIVTQEIRELVTKITEVPVKQQRRIRNELNSSRPKDQQISYAHINPNDSDFKQEYARLIIDEYNNMNYLRKVNEKYDREALDPDIFRKVSTYSRTTLKKHFDLVPLAVRQEIMSSLGCRPENISHYTKEVKQKIVTIFKSQYME